MMHERNGSTTLWMVPKEQRSSMEQILLELHPKRRSQEVSPHEGEEFGYL